MTDKITILNSNLDTLASRVSHLECAAECQHENFDDVFDTLWNHIMALKEEMSTVVSRLDASPAHPSVKVWNDKGTVTFGEEWLQQEGAEMSVVNHSGRVQYGTPASDLEGWAFGYTVFKILVAGGFAYVYLKEIGVVGRGVTAGARLAVEKWEGEKGGNRRDRSKGGRKGSNGGPHHKGLASHQG
jgi:hypothetical protein